MQPNLVSVASGSVKQADGASLLASPFQGFPALGSGGVALLACLTCLSKA